MRFTCSLPVGGGPGGFQSIEALTRAAQAIEAAGCDACYDTDHPAPSREWLDQPQNGAHETVDPLIALTVAATATGRLKLHTNVLVLPYRNPLLAAKSAATLDALSGGRVMLGVGGGYLEAEYAALGTKFADRGRILDEGIRVLRMAWTGEPVTFHTDRFDAREVVVQPRPVQAGGIPIFVGGNSKRAIRRAVELGDGWSPFPAPANVTTFAGTDEFSNMDHLCEKIGLLRELAAQAGRTRPIEISTGRFGHNGQLNAGGLPDPAQAVDDYCAMAEAGVTWFSFSVPAPDLETFLGNVRWFGEAIIAKARRDFSRAVS